MARDAAGSRRVGSLSLIYLMAAGAVALAGAPVPDPVQPEPEAVAKNRFISFVPGNAGQQVALRVTLGHVSLLPDRNGTVRWVGPPAEYDDCDVTENTYIGSALQCTPHYMDWGAIPVLHVTSLDDEVLPDSIYAVQAIFAGDDTNDEADYSAPVIIPTARVYTDSVGWWNGTEWTAPDGLVSFQDVAAGLDKFYGLPTIAHVRAKMTRGNLLTACVGFDSVDNTVPAFEGRLPSPLSGGPYSDPCGDAPLFACGNGVLEPAEECDDGGVAPGDGCDGRCLLEPACGNGIVDPAEECDDGGTVDGDGCDTACRPESVCGNGILEPQEQCDDGGVAPGDGCDEVCRSETATAIISLVPVGSSGSSTIAGNEIVMPDAGQRVTLEIRVSGWDADLDGTPILDLYQSRIDAAGFESGFQGTLTPPTIACSGMRVCAGGPNDLAPCDFPTQCDFYPCDDVACVTELGRGSSCFAPTNTCKAGYIYRKHPDILKGTGGAVPITVTDVTTPSFRFATANLTTFPEPYDGTEKYVGTLVLDASADVRGTFTVEFMTGYADTFLIDEGNFPIPFAEIRPAVISVLTGCCLGDGTCTADVTNCETAGGTLVPACGGDCDGDGENDACAIAAGAPDCDENGVPDGCQSGDCQPNGVGDHCDIADGPSDDCNVDGIPDDCQPDEDCNGNGTRDICDIGNGSSFDCNLDLTPDECQLASGASADENGNGIPDECEAAPAPDPAGLDKNRTISLVPSAEHAVTALRVTLVDLCNTDPDVPDRPACPPRTPPLPELSAYDGAVRSVGPPAAYPSDVVPSMPDFVAAPLQCCPYFRDWSPAALAAEYPAADTSVLHLYGPEVVPCSRYAVETVSVNCTDLGDPACYSDVLERGTGEWGDVSSPYGGTGEPSFIDIGNVVLGFKSIPLTGGQNKPRCLLRNNVLPLDQRVSFIDIGLAVTGFKSLPYPNDGPVACDPCP